MAVSVAYVYRDKLRIFLKGDVLDTEDIKSRSGKIIDAQPVIDRIRAALRFAEKIPGSDGPAELEEVLKALEEAASGGKETEG